jgi:hypothetical protein
MERHREPPSKENKELFRLGLPPNITWCHRVRLTFGTYLAPGRDSNALNQADRTSSSGLICASSGFELKPSISACIGGATPGPASGVITLTYAGRL